jgi:hypothetical protein
VSTYAICRWRKLCRLASFAAGGAILILATLTAGAQADTSPTVFSATTTSVTTGASPNALAIGDLHSATPDRLRQSTRRCNPYFRREARPGCTNDLLTANLGDRTATVLLKDAGDSGFTPPGLPGVGGENSFGVR